MRCNFRNPAVAVNTTSSVAAALTPSTPARSARVSWQSWYDRPTKRHDNDARRIPENGFKLCYQHTIICSKTRLLLPHPRIHLQLEYWMDRMRFHIQRTRIVSFPLLKLFNNRIETLCSGGGVERDVTECRINWWWCSRMNDAARWWCVTTITACNSTRISGWTGKQTGVAPVTQITNFNSGKGPAVLNFYHHC